MCRERARLALGKALICSIERFRSTNDITAYPSKELRVASPKSRRALSDCRLSDAASTKQPDASGDFLWSSIVRVATPAWQMDT
jgi:hypothetical protein